MKKQVVGIDLGTTFSSAAVILPERPDLVADTLNRKDIASMVNFSKKNGIIIGNLAKKQQIRSPERTIYDSKRMLGRKFDDEQIQKLVDKWPFKVEQDESGGILISVNGVDRKYHPYEISGEILKYLVELANKRFPKEERTNKVVITIPANFGEEQRMETMQAAEYAGLEVLQLVNEPTAAGLAFGLQNQNSKPRDIFVFDFGGGTLDVSLLHQEGKKIEVKATDGDMFLGGRDFDENTVNFLIDDLQLDEDFCRSSKKMTRLCDSVIDAKIQLSSTKNATIIISDDGDEDDDDDEYNLTLEKFEEINQSLIDRILIPVKRLLNDNHIDKEQIDTIILVGGSSNMKFVKRELKNFFGKDPYNGVNPEEAVAIGAGIVASQFTEGLNSSSAMKNFEYNDISPFSIGTSDIDGTMDVLIKKGSKIPITRTERFHTVLYRQDTFPVDIFEGENKYVKDNYHLSDFSVTNLPPSEDEIEFDITFSLDKNNILSASAKLVGGDLKVERKIDIKRIKHNLVKPTENEENSRLSSNARECKVLYKNIQRFIDFNKKALLQYYSENELSHIYRDAKDSEEHIDSIELPLCSDLINSYVQIKFKKYFSNHSIPKFLV